MVPGSILDLFTRQYSLVARHQLRDTCTPAERRRLVGHPDIERAGPRVLRHRAGVVERHLDADLDVTVHRGIPIVRPERLLLWLARADTERYGHEVGALRLERTLDHAWREGLIDGRRIHDLAVRCSGKGNSGIVILRALLESRPPDHRPTDSNLERRWEEVVGPLARSFRRQVVLGDDAPIGRFDQAHVERPLVVEIHSEKHHTMPSDVADDHDRASRLVAAGFAVVIYWEYDIWHDARAVRRSLQHR